MQTMARVAATNVDTFGSLRSIYVQHGVRGLYSGVSAPLLAVVPAFAINFWSYDTAKNTLQRLASNESEEATIGHVVLAGGFSGICLASVLAPSERIKCLMQVGNYSSFSACAQQVYAEGGLASLYRGFGATVLRDVPGNMAYFGFYEVSKRAFTRWEGKETASLPATFLAGGLAGVANWIVAIPFDVVKSRYQTAPPGMYNSLWHVLRELLHTEGYASLFRGLSPALIRAFPANGACLAGVETARSVLANWNVVPSSS
jgi:solute carrier family 25 carnitine/acylcarnitine transporter 20/29